MQEDQRNQVYTIAWFAREQQNRFPSTCTGSNAKTSPRYGCRTEIFRETSARHARAHRINSGRADRLAPTCHGELTDFKSNRFGRKPETARFLRGRKNTVRFSQESWGWFRFPGQPPERNFWRETRVFFFSPRNPEISANVATRLVFPLGVESLPRISPDYKSSLFELFGEFARTRVPGCFCCVSLHPCTRVRRDCNAKRQTRYLKTRNHLSRRHSFFSFHCQPGLCVWIYRITFLNGRNNSEKVYRVSLEIDVVRAFAGLCIFIETLWIYNGAYVTISIISHELYSLVSRALSRISHSDFFRYEFAIWFVGRFGVKKTAKIESFTK